MAKNGVVASKKHKKDDGDCEKEIRKLEKEIKRLKSENKSLQNALSTTDEYLVSLTKDKTVNEVIIEVKENADVSIKEKCPNCGAHGMKKINLGTTKIVACKSCPYRNRINESGTGQA